MPAPQPNTADLGAAIRRLRLNKKLTIDELGHRAGVHGTYVSLIERGQANPTWEIIQALTTALVVRPSKLLAQAEEHHLAQPKDEAEEPPAA